jgi:excisionase family DNA binding protein
MREIILTPISLTDLKTVISEAVRIELKNELQTLSPKQPEELLTRKETAEILGISLPTLHEWTISGKIPAYRIGSRVRYKRGEIEQSLNKIRSLRR